MGHSEAFLLLLWKSRLHSLLPEYGNRFLTSTCRPNCTLSGRNWIPQLPERSTSASFCLGPDVVAFEKDFAAWCGANHRVALNSGTSALHLAMIILWRKAVPSLRITMSFMREPARCANTARRGATIMTKSASIIGWKDSRRCARRKTQASDRWTEGRRRAAHRYHQLLVDGPFTLPLEASYAASAYHLYAVRHPQRDQLKAHLEARPIGALCIILCRCTCEMLCVASGIRLVIFRSPKPPLESA